MENPYYLKDIQGDYYNKYPEFQAWEEGKQAGIQEVVEWINNSQIAADIKWAGGWKDWQAKLKKWGIPGRQKERP